MRITRQLRRIPCFTQWVKAAHPGVVLKHKQSQDFTTSETLNPLYETSCGWNSEPQNIEYRTAEFRRMVSLSEA
jgi:hypothetical protein